MSYRVFIDMDGTLARFHAENNYLERMYEPSFFSELAPYENAVEAAAKLAVGGEAEVYVISSVIEGYPPGDCAEQKHAWLDEHLPMIDRAHRIFPPMGANKTEYVPEGVRADDVLVDDYNKNLEEWQSAGGTSVKFVNDINDRGLVGKRWEGERVYYSASAEDTAARLGEIANIAQEKVTQEHRQTKSLSPSLDPTVQPIVTIIWSESNELREGEQMPLARADALFKILDETRHTEREQPGYRGRAYDKTKFRIDFTFRGKADNYEGRQDFGDGDGSLIDHIQEYHEYYSNNESHKNYVILNEGAERWAQEQAEREMLLTEFVPYMRLHCNLYEQERTAADMLESGAELTAAQTAYFNAVISYVGDCRKKLNAGDYELPDPPQLSNFSQEAAETEASPVIDLEELLDEAKDRIEEKAAIEGEAVAPQAPVPTVPSIKREELPKDKDELEAHLAARIETLVSGFALDPDKLMEHIRFTARFHKYSSRNLMLIAAQYPTASFVTSFSRFAKGIPDDRGVPLTDKNCSVKKGERAIYIYGYRSTEYVVDPDTGRELAVRHLSDKLAARARDEGWEKRTRTYYPIVPVFDISQTNTPPEVYPAVMGFGGTANRDADAQFRAAKNYAENVLGCSVEICDMGERKATVRGNFTPSENAIRISSMLSGDGALSTLLHEIGHAELHADAEYLKDKPLSQIELEADMLAVMYEDHLGIAQTDARKAHLHSHYTRYLEQLRAEQGEGYDLLGKDSPFEHVVAKYQERIELFDEFQRLQEDFDLEAKAAQSRAVAVAPEMKPAESENRSAKTSGTKI